VSDGEIKGLATSGLMSAAARDLVTPQEFQVMIADAKAGRSMPVDSDADPFRDPSLPVASAGREGTHYIAGLQFGAEAVGVSWNALDAFRTAARALKAAELAFRDAQQVYAEAVKRMSEEAVK